MTANTENSIKIDFKIGSIELAEKSFHIPELKENNVPEVQFDIAISIHIDKPNNRIVNALQVKIKKMPEQIIVGSIAVALAFDIQNFEEVIIINGEQLSIPDPVAETLNIVTIGTARGIMYSEFKGTWLHNSILPVIDPKSFRQTQPVNL